MNGAFKRVQPDPQFPPRLGDDISFSGDGSNLLVFDALAIEKGPIAMIAIPIRLRFGLHGNWANAAEIGLAA